MNDEPRRRRSGGRAARIATRRAPLEADQRAVRPGLSGGKFRPLADSEIQQVYDTALELLEDIGMGSPVPEFVQVVSGDKVHFGTAGAAVLMHDHETNTFRHTAAVDVYDCAWLVDRLDNIHFSPEVDAAIRDTFPIVLAPRPAG